MKKFKNILVKDKSLKTTEEVAKFLHTLADRIAEKKVKFAQGEVETEVELPDNLCFSVKAREKELRKKGLTRKLTFRLFWSDGKDFHTPLEVK
jgi:amphi-Trp domain-containing protein